MDNCLKKKIEIQEFYKKENKYKDFQIVKKNQFEIKALVKANEKLNENELEILSDNLATEKFNKELLNKVKELVIIDGFISLKSQTKYFKNIKLKFINDLSYKY